MQIRNTGVWRVGAVLLIAGSVTGCTVDTQDAPPLAGPSTTAQALTLSASPDRIAHNGSAQSSITLTMHNQAGQPVVGQRVSVGASTGSISHLDVVTGADGRANFTVMAPALSTPAVEIQVFATPFGTDADGALTRTLKIALTGRLNATAPTASFTLTPDPPVEGGSVVFDASPTTDEGEVCGDRCVYSWHFGGLGAGITDGKIVTRNILNAGVYPVTLTVVDDAGTVSTSTRSVTVAPGAQQP